MGRPKLSLPFGAETMLARVVRIVKDVVSPVVVVAATEQELPKLPPGILVTRDEVSGQGPLAGLAAGIKALRGSVDAVYLSSCDVPLLKTEFIRAMIDAIALHEMAMPCEGQQAHPLAGVYRTSVESRVRRMLADGRLKAQLLIHDSDACLIDVAELRHIDPALESLKNVNSPDDYREALLAASLPSDLDDS